MDSISSNHSKIFLKDLDLQRDSFAKIVCEKSRLIKIVRLLFIRLLKIFVERFRSQNHEKQLTLRLTENIGLRSAKPLQIIPNVVEVNPIPLV